MTGALWYRPYALYRAAVAATLRVDPSGPVTVSELLAAGDRTGALMEPLPRSPYMSADHVITAADIASWRDSAHRETLALLDVHQAVTGDFCRGTAALEVWRDGPC